MWTSRIHRMLLLWLNQIGANRKSHHMASVAAADLNNRLLVATIIISALSSFSSFININEFPEIVRKSLAIIVGVFTIVNIILLGIISEMKLGEVSQRNRQTAAEYSDISALVQMTVVTPEKPPVEQFLQRLLDRLSIIQRYGPDSLDHHASIADLPNLILVKSAMRGKRASESLKSKDLLEDSDDHLLMPSTEHTADNSIAMQEIKIDNDSE